MLIDTLYSKGSLLHLFPRVLGHEGIGYISLGEVLIFIYTLYLSKSTSMYCRVVESIGRVRDLIEGDLVIPTNLREFQ
uniref:Uncharacterized protein n=1 Tax=Salix viminalis TaxID=40686 RepID=A0A6N2KVQ5_SALVM